MPQPGQRLFLNWDKPWVTTVARWLLDEPEKLPRRLVVVPTRESARRLRDALLPLARERGKLSLLGPRTATPDAFFAARSSMPVAVGWAGWIQVLHEARDQDVSELFPLGLSGKDDAWRLGVARKIEQTRAVLVALDTDISSVCSQLQAPPPQSTDVAAWDRERLRWQQLQRLEKMARRIWALIGYDDPVAVQQACARTPELPSGVQEVVLAGVTDPNPLAVTTWERLRNLGIPFSVLVPAPAEFKAAFDEWGRPLPDHWLDRTLHPTPQPSQWCLTANGDGLARTVVKSCLNKTNREIAIGVCDRELIPLIDRAVRASGWTPFDPEGVKWPRDGWPGFFEALASAVEHPSEYVSLAALARHPFVWNPRLAGHEASSVFAALDDWEINFGPAAAEEAISRLLAAGNHARLRKAGRLLQRTQAWLRSLGRDEDRYLWRIIEPAFDSEELSNLCQKEREGWRKLEATEFGLPLRLRWLGAAASELSRSREAHGSDIELQGWLELLFDPAPHLILAGMHEGCVPEPQHEDVLISETLREQLGWHDRRWRLARDLFLFTVFVANRRNCGSVTALLAQTSPQGEPRLPSRVLLHTSLTELPARVQALVKEIPDVPPRPTPSWNRGQWQLRPPASARPNRAWDHVSPSQLKLYLTCPTRFYFERVLKWQSFERYEGELEASVFGSLIHEALSRWGNDAQLRESADPEALRQAWRDMLDQEVQARFGERLPAVLKMQVISAHERLQALAPVQCRERRQGWHILAAEKELKGVLHLAGLPLVLRIDRIDQHDDGRVRVIDYKTHRNATLPARAHLKPFQQGESPPPLGPLVLQGKTRKTELRWVDLQLPLYALAVQKALNLPSPPQAFYVALPEAVSAVEFIEFAGMADLLDNARQWAEAAADRIVRGVFWPPVKETLFDEFQGMAPEGLDQALGSEWEELLSGTTPIINQANA
jgi:ATP-dependent helicase/nuclease subunit B